MFLFALSLLPKRLFLAGGLALMALSSLPAHAQPDPPAQAGRVSYISGNVSFQPVGTNDWGQAYPNLPLGPGDRVFTDGDGRAEIQVGQTFLRIGPNTDVSLVDATPDGIYFGVAQGSVHLRSDGLWDGQSVYINTPSGSGMLSQAPGGMRVDVIPDQQAAVFSSFISNLLLTGAGGFSQYLGPQQALELIGSNPVVPQWLQPSVADPLDDWSNEREAQIQRAGYYQRYVSPEIPGAYELDSAGTWMPGTEYGAVWFPNNVGPGWAPYHNGHWVNRAPWGWVWVEDEQWGYAPFHYGRWVNYRGRWGWVPGPPAERPVWSPALVVFAAGVNFGGATVSAWFPLGPGEPYHPWYPCSPRYVDRVNISNITVTNVVHVQTTYVNVTNVTYVNRSIGVTAMRHEDFAAGRPAREVAVAVDLRQMERVQPLAAPVPRPMPQAIIGRPPLRAVPVSTARPVLINSRGMAVSTTPGARPMAPPVRVAPPPRPLAGRMVIAPPPNAGKPMPPARMPGQPTRPEEHTAPVIASPAIAAPARTIPPNELAPKHEQPVNRPMPPSEAGPKPAPPVNQPVTPVPPRPVTKPAETVAPPHVEEKPADPSRRPPFNKPPTEAVPPPHEVKPPPPPKPEGKSDKEKKDEKNKDKDKDKPQI